MPERKPNRSVPNKLPADLERVGTSSGAAELKPLLRMRQLSIEIERGVESNNLELVCKAAALLAPALSQIKAAQPNLDVSAGESAQIALDTYNCLRASERSLEEMMRRIAVEIARLQRGTRKLALTRSRFMRQPHPRRIDRRT